MCDNAYEAVTRDVEIIIGIEGHVNIYPALIAEKPNA